MKPRTWIPAALVTLLATAACQELVEPLADPPEFEGTVTHVSLDGLGSISVALSKALGGATFDRAGFNFRAANEAPVAAMFVREGNGAAVEASIQDINVGDKVEIWTTGVEMRSDPPQYTATQIVIVRD